MNPLPMNQSNSLSTLLFGLVITLLVAAGCNMEYKPKAKGSLDSILLVVDTTQHNASLVPAIREVFEQAIPHVPGYEPQYKVQIASFERESDLSVIENRTNVVIAAPLDEQTPTGSLVRSMLNESFEQNVRNGTSFAFPAKDVWARNQWVLVLTGMDTVTMKQAILEADTRLFEPLQTYELERWTRDIYEKGEQVELADSLMAHAGWSVRMQHDYVWTFDTTRFVQFRRPLVDNDRWIWGAWEELQDPGVITPSWIQAKRDSILATYLKGSRPNSYITTETRRPVSTSLLDESEHLAFETLGTWTMVNDFMGGPFVHFTYYIPEQERVIFVEYGQFAPQVGKRRFVRQFRAMGRTFKVDTTLTTDSSK